jgi:hypothetical protein
MNMKIKSLKINDLLFIVVLFSIFLTACGGEEKTMTVEEQEESMEVDRSRSSLLNINGEIFAIPSPIQTSLLIKGSGNNYSKEMLVTPAGIDSYLTKFQKAINLGVLGADMGYVTIFDQTQDALHYLKVIKDLADDLGVMGAFDKTLLDRFEKNMGNQDSLLSLVSDAYRVSDAYLKNQDRNDVGVLILAGGFIESLYFAVNVAESTKNQDMVVRIGEQKSSLDNLIKLLSPFYGKEEFKNLTDNLIDLSEAFDGVEYNYIYEKPVTDAANKITTINSRTEIKISDDQFKKIAKKVRDIRNKIIS